MNKYLLFSALFSLSSFSFAGSQNAERILPLPTKFLNSLEPGPGCIQFVKEDTLVTGIPDNLSEKYDYASGDFVNLNGKITPFLYNVKSGKSVSGVYSIEYKELKRGSSYEPRESETIGQLTLFKNNKKVQVINNVHQSCSD